MTIVLGNLPFLLSRIYYIRKTKIFFIIFIILQAQYHAEFEKTKGKLTQVADDPETLRIKANSKIIR